jgi:hypothetical protein
MADWVPCQNVHKHIGIRFEEGYYITKEQRFGREKLLPSETQLCDHRKWEVWKKCERR